MKYFRTTERSPRLKRVTLGAISIGAAVMVATACSSSSSSTGASGGSTPASSGGGASASAGSSSGGSSSVDQSALTTAQGVPTFSQFASGYGSKVDISSLKGKKVMIIPGVSALAACTEIAQAAAVLAKDAGMVPTIFQNQGTTAEHNAGIENAIHQGYAAIMMGCAYDPTTNAPAIAQAVKAGLKFSFYGVTPAQQKAININYVNVDPYALDGKLSVDQAVAHANGKPFTALSITSNATAATGLMRDAMTAELAKVCPQCKVNEVNVEVPKWTTDISGAVSSALLQHPDTTVLFPYYAGMLTYVLQGMQAAHKSTGVTAYLNFGGGTPFIKLQTQAPGKDIIQGQLGGYPPWTGYLMFLQLARSLTGMAPLGTIDNQVAGPNRLVTPDNAVDVLTTGGNGTDWVNGFRALLGLPALSGAALTSAATLGGSMTDKP
jgi:ribose transport system substrate-binding protein